MLKSVLKNENAADRMTFLAESQAGAFQFFNIKRAGCVGSLNTVFLTYFRLFKDMNIIFALWKFLYNY